VSGLRLRLVLALVVVAILPAVPLSIIVRSLLERSFHPPFEGQVDAALEASLAEARDRLRAEKEELAEWVDRVGAPAVARGEVPSPPGGLALRVAAAGHVGKPVGGEVAADEASELGHWARARAAEDRTGPGEEPERVGAAVAQVVPVPAGDGALVVFARRLPDGLAADAQRTAETLALRRAFAEERPAVLQSYVLPFLLSYGLLLALAVGVGVVIAGRIARPVEALAEGAARVGAGDLDTRVRVRASGEVGELVDAFNRMVAALATQRSELARLERVAAWRDLARSLAHEIKNPLTPIQLAVQQLGDNYRKDDEYGRLLSECVEIVDEEVASLRRLVKEFSGFARLPEPRPEPGDLAELLDELGKLYGERFAWAGPRPLPARFDADELKRALINLVDNGLAACAEAGRPELVRVDAGPAADGLLVRVADEGAGIPEANRERIFEPDFSTKSEGMGLGLAIVEGIVRGHGGSIGVESAPGAGTTFTIRLPAEGGDR
jgi:nitrogen fixation/metabolism regulation signal transduction histidine kinase